MRRLFAFVLFAAFTLTAARAQSVHWENSDSGDASEVTLVFQDCSPNGDPQLPTIAGTTFALMGRSENMSVVNFSMTRTLVLSYRVRTTRSGAIQIPAFTVQTNKGAIKVPAFTGGVPRTAADANVTARLEPAATTVWAGEVFGLTYTLDLPRRSLNQANATIDWNPAPLVTEDWSKFEQAEFMVSGEAHIDLVCRTRGYAKTDGHISLNSANQLVNLQSGNVGFGLFSMPRIEQLSVASDRPTINVRPLPPAPAGFRGAVGHIKLTSKVVPTTAAVGEPITWTLELSGTGNWPDIPGLPQREVSKDFNVVSPQAKRTPAEGKLFDATLTEDVVLVPTKSGSYTLSPVAFVYFDPAAGDYKTINTPQTTVTVSAPLPPVGTAVPAVRSANPTEAAPKSASTSAESKIENREAKISPPPVGLPREPLSGATVASVPLTRRTLFAYVALPFAFLPFFWAFLAIRRARETDPLRPQREARARLSATLSQLSTLNSQPSSSGSQLSALNSQLQQQPLLLAWQHDTALLFRLSYAAPSPHVVGTALRAVRPPLSEADAAAWSQLWLESDRALYSADAALTPEWATRAEAALAAKRLPGFQPLAAFLPRNLFPFVAAVALLLTLAPFASGQTPNSASTTRNPEPVTPNSELRTPISAASAASAYQRGDFAAAEQAWSAALTKTPTDSVARHNLSLALAQQDRWGEAAAHAAAAFVQNPASASIRWQLALASNKAGYAPASLAAFLPPGPLQSLAGRASPAQWQYAAILAAVLAALALAVLIFGAYRAASRVRTTSAFTLLTLAVLLGFASAASLHAYGDTADRRAVIAWRAGTLRSIPTEADTTQKTTPLSAGALAIEEKPLLGWVRLRFENGQTGWVRKEEVIALWR